MGGFQFKFVLLIFTCPMVLGDLFEYGRCFSGIDGHCIVIKP